MLYSLRRAVSLDSVGATSPSRQGRRHRTAGVRLSEIASIRPRDRNARDGVCTGVIVGREAQRDYSGGGGGFTVCTSVLELLGW
jgi:hypothetical protein